MEFTDKFEAASAKMDELKAKMDEASKAVKESVAQGAANFKSDMKFTQESIDEIFDDAEDRAEEKREERREASRAKIKNLQDKINDLSQAYARADQEELIVNLITYADECKETAIEMAEEAVLAYKAAAEQIALYNEKYGE